MKKPRPLMPPLLLLYGLAALFFGGICCLGLLLVLSSPENYNLGFAAGEGFPSVKTIGLGAALLLSGVGVFVRRKALVFALLAYLVVRYLLLIFSGSYESWVEMAGGFVLVFFSGRYFLLNPQVQRYLSKQPEPGEQNAAPQIRPRWRVGD